MADIPDDADRDHPLNRNETGAAPGGCLETAELMTQVRNRSPTDETATASRRGFMHALTGFAGVGFSNPMAAAANDTSTTEPEPEGETATDDIVVYRVTGTPRIDAIGDAFRRALGVAAGLTVGFAVAFALLGPAVASAAVFARMAAIVLVAMVIGQRVGARRFDTVFAVAVVVFAAIVGATVVVY